MPDYQQSIDDHYGRSDLSTVILDALKNAGKDIDALTREDLYSFDQFHSGGLTSTQELASLAGISEVLRSHFCNRVAVMKIHLLSDTKGFEVWRDNPDGESVACHESCRFQTCHRENDPH